MSRFRIPGLISGIVFAAFVAFTFLSPATYRASATIAVEPGAGAPELPAPLEATRRLHEAVLDRTVLEELSRSREPGAPAGTVGEIQSALEIDTSDSKTFTISFRDGDDVRAQRVCNQLARHAVERAPTALAAERVAGDRSLETERQRRTEALTGFLAAHPELMAESSAQGKKSPESDRMTLALRAERARLEQKLLSAAQGGRAKSDNPYDDPPDPSADPTILRRRMAEIDTTLQIRQKAAGAESPSSSAPGPEVLSEWRRLVQALADVGAQKPKAPSAVLKARIVQEALLPSSPIEPNRPLVLLIGMLAALGLGGFTFIRLRQGGGEGWPTDPRQAGYTPIDTRPPARYEPLPTPPETEVPLLPAAEPEPPPARPPRAGTLAYGTPAYQPELPDPEPATNGATQEAHVATVAADNPPPVRLKPIPNFSIGASDRVDARVELPSVELPSVEVPSVEVPTELVRESAPAEEWRPGGAENSWNQATFAPADPKFAAVLDAAAQAVRASDPRVIGSEQPAATVIISEPPPVFAKPSAADERTPSGEQPSFRPVRSKVTQRMGSFPASDWNGVPGIAQRISTPAGGYSHVSTPPPPEEWIVTIVKASAEWHPDRDLLPESRRDIRDQLFQHAVEQCFVVAVSSVEEAGEGKSRIAAELALALAESGHPRILLMEGNFHQPSVHRHLRVDMPPQMGFSQQLHARISGGRERWTVIECKRSLHVLAEGLMRSPGLLLSKQFESCLTDLRTYYDLIIVDGPPASLEVDCRALDSVTDGLLLACPSGGSPSILRARNAFGEKTFFAVVPT